MKSKLNRWIWIIEEEKDEGTEFCTVAELLLSSVGLKDCFVERVGSSTLIEFMLLLHKKTLCS